MYDIRNLNIWKERTESSSQGWKEKVLEIDVFGKESILSDAFVVVLAEMMMLVSHADFAEIKKRRCGKLKFPMYVNNMLMGTSIDALDLSPRSSNCLHRAGFNTIGELVESIESFEDLKKIRNCGTKSIKEIMGKLFCYQYGQLKPEKKERFIKRIIELNK